MTTWPLSENPQAMRIQAFYQAVLCHWGQYDKQGKPYIEHLVRVADKAFRAGLYDLIPAALLHDTLEDSDKVCADYLRMVFGERTADLVLILTRTKKESYADYIEKICMSSKDARYLKKFDLEDHLEVGNISSSLIKRYEQALTKINRTLVNE